MAAVTTHAPEQALGPVIWIIPPLEGVVDDNRHLATTHQASAA